MKFEWDINKNKQNIEKHGIDFRDATQIFENARIIKEDKRKGYEEKRWILLGKMFEVVVVAIYTIRNNTIRIISVRKANKKERNIYHEKTK